MKIQHHINMEEQSGVLSTHIHHEQGDGDNLEHGCLDQRR
jgi:hypothetical protein